MSEKRDFTKFDSQKEFNWKLDECESLKRRVNELEAALDVIAEREAKNADEEIKNTIPGIILDSAGFAFSAETTPAPEHFFPANHFMVKKAGASLHIVFGSRSAFSSSDDLFYNLAVEVDMPLSYASEFLYRAAFFHPTLRPRPSDYR